MKPILVSLSLLIVIMSCVAPTKFNDLQNAHDDCRKERDKLVAENENLSVENKELNTKYDAMQNSINKYEQDSIKWTKEIDFVNSRFKNLDKQYNDLKKAQESLLAGSTEETQKILSQLLSSQEDLQMKEDELNRLSRTLDKEKQNLEVLKSELESKNVKLLELETILNQKDAAVDALKQKVTSALLGFENQGLTITKKNGKVYVSLEEKLLFKSGSTEVDSKGIAALKKLAKVLEQNPDINIMIEGHTDNVPVIQSSKFNDNWDLSVQRATSIVRILLDGSSINPKRLIAAGRGEFSPIAPNNTPESKQKNRRTEIILSPKLDELFEILDSN